jgi:isopentenyldiphosphate isomerase
MQETIFSSGKIFELVHVPQPDGRVFEVARRAPGVRLIVADMANKKVLLTKEFRRELNTHDFRLPGGKVFDTLAEYEAHRKSGGDILKAATKKVKAEAVEEAGVAVDDVTFYKKSTLGATVEWDLYVFVATEWRNVDQALEQGEQVDDVSWYSFADVQEMILRGDMQEDRIALVLLRWLKQIGDK